MSPVTYQTARLSKGKHISPEDGVCVMELASMLAGEPFTDHPACACPVIGSFLRAYNDSLDDSRRQDLYAYASKVVGSRRTGAVQRARAERLAEWEFELRRRRWCRRLLPKRLRTLGLRPRHALDTAGTHAVHAIRRHNDTIHAEALALIDELLAIGTPPAVRIVPERRIIMPKPTTVA
ncbi:MAG TPA: hypothetical protein VKT31_03020 [Solirubrobacteraceae bacterium]|nr:hypothetical protein [Solirubrobacteraceae bacterium]